MAAYERNKAGVNWIANNWRSFWKNPWQGKYVAPLLAVNILGSAYGYYWYAGQLASTAKGLWLFVPDSPLSTTLFSAVLILWLLGYRSTFFSVVAFTSCIKYGIWAVVVISDFWAGGGAVRFTEAMLWASHLGMAAEAAIFFKSLPSPGGSAGGLVLAGTAAWMLINDFLDYYLGIYPYLYTSDQIILAALSAVGLSLILIVSIFVVFTAGKANNSR